MKKFTLLFVAGLAISLLIAACGGAAEPAGPAPVTLNFSGYDEFRYDPPTASVPTGAEVTVNFKNEGALEHNWILVTGDVDPATVSEADALAGANVGLVPGGESGSVTFVAPAPGIYQMVCTVAGHAPGGMVGEFMVTNN